MKTQEGINIPFSVSEMDGKRVEFETQGRATDFGRLWVRQIDDGTIEIKIRKLASADAQEPLPPLEELLSFEKLRRNPKPEISDFLLVKDLQQYLQDRG